MALAIALRNFSTTKLDKLPRLADFARWATAAEPGLGLQSGSIMKAFNSNRADSTALLLDCDLARSIIDLASEGFRGTASDLGRRVGWETSGKGARALAGEVRYLAPSLRDQGIEIDFKASHGRKLISIGYPIKASGARQNETISQ